MYSHVNGPFQLILVTDCFYPNRTANLILQKQILKFTINKQFDLENELNEFNDEKEKIDQRIKEQLKEVEEIVQINIKQMVQRCGPFTESQYDKKDLEEAAKEFK
ncbi:Hypothetical_protein [Hexamita inflata]|uniref:Hypothetical_protein n=1 Tax=Hexamita inflata TaxID=28002 RepID=A0AA86RRC4_9EUKA|nr:Hypothetical protein HINF_LOCUS64282 [Hexamita inflata]